MELPATEPIQPTQDMIADALQHRADLVESRIQLNTTEISNKAVRSALLPTVNLFAYYGGAGVGGSQNPANVCTTPPTAVAERAYSAAQTILSPTSRPGS
jgi:outer membrane protein TolC